MLIITKIVSIFVGTIDEIQYFLNDFFAKSRTFDILFKDNRQKNTAAIFDLDLTRAMRIDIINTLVALDYSEGPLDDNVFQVAPMWVFGKRYKKTEIYIKISMGTPGSNTICISFHRSEHPMHYPFKPTT